MAQLKSQKHSLTATDAVTASNNVSSLITYVEKSVRAAKKSGMLIDNLTTFGDFFLHIPAVVINEVIKKHKFEEEVFFLLCGTICEAQITDHDHDHEVIEIEHLYNCLVHYPHHQLTREEDTLEKLKLDRQQWRLSADVVGAETQDFTSTITCVSCNTRAKILTLTSLM